MPTDVTELVCISKMGEKFLINFSVVLKSILDRAVHHLGPQLKNLVSALKSLAFAVVFWYGVAIFSVPIFVLRLFVKIGLYLIHGDQYQLMSSSESIYGHLCKNNSSIIHVAKVHRGKPNVEKIRESYRDTVFNAEDKTGSGNLQKIVIKKWGFPCWLQRSKNNFNVNEHVKLLEGVVANHDIVQEEKLFNIICSLMSTILPANKPQWEHLIIPHYLPSLNWRGYRPDHYFVSIYRLHCAYYASVSFAPWKPVCWKKEDQTYLMQCGKELSFLQRIKVHLKSFIFGPRDFWLKMKKCSSDQSLLIVDEYSKKKFVGWSKPINSGLLRSVEEKSHCDIQSILVTCVTGAVRKFHEQRYSWYNKGRIPSEINCTTILPNHSSGRSTVQSYVIPYPFRDTDIYCRLIKNSFKTKKFRNHEKTDPHFNDFILQVAGMLPQLLQDFAVNLLGTPMVFCYINGGKPDERDLFGTQVVDSGMWIPCFKKFGIGVIVHSYNDIIKLCVTADSYVFEERKILEDFLKDFECEVEEISNIFSAEKARI